MVASPRPLLRFDRTKAGFAIQLAFAAWLAFAIAYLLGVPNPYWAGMPVWVVAQPTRGLLLEKGFYRFSGTVVGGIAGLGILALPLGPYGHLALLAVWVGLSSAATRAFRATHAYGGLLSGITAAVVVLPTALTPDRAEGVALARGACTLIGVVVAILVTGLFTPRAEVETHAQELPALSEDATAFARSAIQGVIEVEDKTRILGEIARLEERAYLAAAASMTGYRRHRRLATQVQASLEAMAAGIALGRRRLRGEVLPKETVESILAGEEPAVAMSEGSPALRLVRAVRTLRSSETTDGTPEVGHAPVAYDRDMASVWRAGLVSGGATFAASVLGLASGWTAGELWALGVCLFSMVLVWMDSPRAFAPGLFQGAACGAVVGAFYRFLLQPHLHSTAAVLLSLAPFVVVGGFARVGKRSGMPALDANMCFMMGSGAGLPAVGAAAILNGAAALILGAGLVAGAIVWIPFLSPSPDRSAARSIRRDLVRIVAGKPLDAARLVPHVLRLQRQLRAPDSPRAGTLDALNLAWAVVWLRERSLTAALDDLRDFAVRPEDAARRLVARSEATATNVEDAALMRDAADALVGCADLLRYGGPNSV